jgi:hypothetical protein
VAVQLAFVVVLSSVAVPYPGKTLFPESGTLGGVGGAVPGAVVVGVPVAGGGFVAVVVELASEQAATITGTERAPIAPNARLRNRFMMVNSRGETRADCASDRTTHAVRVLGRDSCTS